VAQKARRIDMSEQRNGERIWDIIERVGVCMLTTQAAGRLRARPLEARLDRKAGLIFAVTDVHSAKQDEIEAAPDVGLVVIEAKAKAYLSITARACVMRDTAKIAQVWRKTDEAWWPGGPSDPNVCLLWDGPASTARTVFEFAKAWLTGRSSARSLAIVLPRTFATHAPA
jgi:general stress protein 26